MLTSTRPVYYTPNNYPSSFAGGYLTYALRLAPSVWNDEEQLYERQNNNSLFTGKSFFRELDNGRSGTQVEVSSILNDNRWQWKREWDDEQQKYLPVFETITEGDCQSLTPQNETTLGIEPIEISENKLYRCPVSVTWMIGVGLDILHNVQSGFTTVEFGNDVEVKDPYVDNADNKYVYVYNDYYGILPHIPDIETSNFWFSAQFGVAMKPKEESVSLFIGGRGTSQPCQRFAIPNDAGNYSCTISLDNLYAYTNAQVNRGIYLYINTPLPVQKPPMLGIVDECPADYYVSWITPMNTWQSQGFTGRRIIRHSIDNTKMTDMVQRQSVIKTDTGTQFVMNSGIIGEQMYNLLMTIPMSDCIYIYDTKKDEGMFVLCDDTNVTTQRGNRNMQLTFSEIRHNIR